MEPKELSLYIQLTEKDYINFQWDHTGFLKSKRWLFYLAFLFVLFGIIYLPYIIQEGFTGIDFSGLYPLLSIPVIFIILYITIIYRAKSAFKNDPFSNHPQKIRINEEGIFVEAYRSNLSPVWQDVYRYHVTKHTVYIYIAEVKALIIPLRCLTGDDKNLLLDFLKTKVNSNNYVKQKRKNRFVKLAIFIVAIGAGIFIALSGDNDVDERLLKAYDYEQAKNFAAAKKLYTELIASEPENPTNYLRRANCEIYLMESGFAVMDCEKAIKLNPENGEAYYYYAYSLYNNQRYDAACKAIHKSIDLGYTSSTQKMCDMTDAKRDSMAMQPE